MGGAQQQASQVHCAHHDHRAAWFFQRRSHAGLYPHQALVMLAWLPIVDWCVDSCRVTRKPRLSRISAHTTYRLPTEGGLMLRRDRFNRVHILRHEHLPICRKNWHRNGATRAVTIDMIVNVWRLEIAKPLIQTEARNTA